jgi:hypothetical protein
MADDPMVLTVEDRARLNQAVIQRAARFAQLPSAPFGIVGSGEESQTQVRRDAEIIDLLHGLRLGPDVDLAAQVWPTTVEVIAAVYGTVTLSTDQTAKVDRARLAAISWVTRHIHGQAAVA